MALRLPLVLCLALTPTLCAARDVYVSHSTGSNKGPGTKEAPKKLLWRVMGELQEGDHVRVAEGVYHGQNKQGVMPKIGVSNVTIEGGWNADFTARDPFKHLTIITAAEDTQGDTREVFFCEGPSGITIDGFCIDRGPSLYYLGRGHGGPNKEIEGHVDNSCWGFRALNKKKGGSDPAIELLGKGSFTVRNMILVNNPWWGINIKAGGTGEVIIENNLILSYQGRGIEAIGGGGWGKPKFIIRNNTVAFGNAIEGRAISIDARPGSSTSYVVEKNVLAFGADSGLMTKFGAETLTLANNLFFGFAKADCGDGGKATCNAGEFEDALQCENAGNVHELPRFIGKLAKDWVDLWSQAKGMTSDFCPSEAIMAARKLAGLGAYELPFFAGKTFAGYDDLPDEPMDFAMSRYPKAYKKGEALMDWSTFVIPVLGADGERGVQPVAR